MKATLTFIACLLITTFLNAKETKHLKQVSQNQETNIKTRSFAEREIFLQENWETRFNAQKKGTDPKLESATIVNKTVNITAGGLASALTASEKATGTNLTITGTIDALDFKTMHNDMTVLDKGSLFTDCKCR